MQLLDRYLNAVRFWLPSAQQEDIIAELGDDLRAEISDRESDLGRPLHDDELAAILKRRGDPVLVAGNYLDHKPLIGPALLPIYWFVVKLVTLWVLIPVFVLVVGPIEMTEMSSLAAAWGTALWGLLTAQIVAFGVITIIFVALERSGAAARAFGKSATDWDPAKLPVLPLSMTHQTTVPKATAIAEIASGAFLAIICLAFFWDAIPQVFAIGRAHIELSAAPVWASVRWPILALCLANVVLGAFGLLRPYAIRPRLACQIAIDAANLAVIAVLLWAGYWLVFGTDVPTQAVKDAANWSNFGIRLSLGIAAGITGIALSQKIARYTGKKLGIPQSSVPRLAP